MEIDLTSDGEELLVKYTPREASSLALVGGLRRSGDFFVSEKSLSIILQLKELFGDKLVYSQQVLDWGFDVRKRRASGYGRTIEALPPRLLYPHQERGSDWLCYSENGLLGHQPGCGKTATAIRSLVRVKAFPALVICPNTLKRTWEAECKKWAPDLNVVILDGTASKRKKALKLNADVYAINFEGLPSLAHVGRYGSLPVETKHGELNEIPWKAIIVDECQRLINPKAKSTRCVKELSRGKYIEYRWALSGTPVRNTAADFWSLLNFFEPTVWTSRSKFIDMFCETSNNFWGGLEVLGIKPARKKLFDEIVDLYLDFVAKEDVLPDLPPKTFSTRYIEMKPKQSKQYKQMLDDMIIKTDDGEYIIATSPLTASARLSQAACATLEVVGDVVNLDTPSCKVDALVELAGEMGDQAFVAFASSKKLVNLCADKLRSLGYKVVLITGDQDTTERQYNIESFQAGRAQILLMTAAGSEGVTLTAASTLVFIQIPWSNIVYQQVQDRVHRIGSTGDKVSIIHLITQGTVEEKVMVALDSKDEHLTDLLGSKKEMGRWLMDEEYATSKSVQMKLNI